MSGFRTVLAFVSIAAALVSGGPLGAETVSIVADRDNTLYKTLTGSLSNGSGMHMFAGNNAVGMSRRVVVHFDVAGNIPAGAVIGNVTLTMYMSRTTSAGQAVRLHRVVDDWGEGASNASGQEGGGALSALGDATWLYRFFPTDYWAAMGGDYVTTPSASLFVVFVGPYSWGSSVETVADVQSWLDDPGVNHGWIVIGNESGTRTTKRFDSRENPIAARRPLLTVEFELPCIDPDPSGQGFWLRQCLGVPVSQGGLAPGRRGIGPWVSTEPGFVEELMPCADARLAELGFGGDTTCSGLDAHPRNDPCERALKQLTALILNRCSGRVTGSCDVDVGVEGCAAATVGPLIDEAADLIHTGECRQAASCVAVVNEGAVSVPAPE